MLDNEHTMADVTEFETSLYKALEERVAWFDSSVLPPVLEDYRVIHSCTANLMNMLVQKGTIVPDPYRLDKKISDVQVPDEGPFPEKDRNMTIGVRLSDYERMLDFLCNFFKFSVQNLTLERIKRLVSLNNYFQWSSFAANSSQVNTKALAEIVVTIRQGSDPMAIGVINNSISSAAKSTVKINSVLKQVTTLQRELYKAEIRKNVLANSSFPKDKINSTQAGVQAVKKMFSSCMGKQPFYSELVEEVFSENMAPDWVQKRQNLLNSLKITQQTTEKKVAQVDTKTLIMEAVRTLAAVAPLLSVIVDKLNDNSSVIQSEHQGIGEKFMKALRKAFGIKEKPIEYDIPIVDSVTQTTRNERVNFQKSITDLTKRYTFYNSFAAKQMPGYQKIESMTEAEILSFLTKQLAECQGVLTTLFGFDKFFKTAAQPLNRSKIKGIGMELTSIKNNLVKTNQRRAEYSAYVEEQQQMRKLGITNVL